MSDEDVTVPKHNLHMEMSGALAVIRSYRQELWDLEEKLVVQEVRIRNGAKVSVRSLVMLLRASADRMSDRAVIMHDCARRLDEEITPKRKK